MLLTVLLVVAEENWSFECVRSTALFIANDRRLGIESNHLLKGDEIFVLLVFSVPILLECQRDSSDCLVGEAGSITKR